MARVNKFQGSGFLKNSVLLGVAHTGKISIDFLKAAANSDFGITEIMSHPGYTDGLESCRTRLVNERKFELDSLCSEQAVNCFKNAGIKLVHYGQI
jgi:predicted glycoside hydrolase/deacetylase ChbG (UPF0249 family)